MYPFAFFSERLTYRAREGYYIVTSNLLYLMDAIDIKSSIGSQFGYVLFGYYA